MPRRPAKLRPKKSKRVIKTQPWVKHGLAGFAVHFLTAVSISEQKSRRGHLGFTPKA